MWTVYECLLEPGFKHTFVYRPHNRSDDVSVWGLSNRDRDHSTECRWPATKWPLGWLAATAVALAHLSGLAHDGHGAPVLDEMICVLLSQQIDHTGVEFAFDEFVLVLAFGAIPVRCIASMDIDEPGACEHLGKSFQCVECVGEPLDLEPVAHVV